MRRRAGLLGLGTLLLAAGSLYTGTTAAFLGHAERTTALVQDPGSGGRHPTLRFTLPSGERVQIVAGGLFKAVHPGDAVEVVYDPAAPVASAAPDTVAALDAGGSAVRTGRELAGARRAYVLVRQEGSFF